MKNILALVSAAFLLGCSAESYFEGNDSGDFPSMEQPSQPAQPSSSSGSPVYGSCTVFGECIPNVQQSICQSFGAFVPNGSCNETLGSQYCYNSDGEGDCDEIGNGCNVKSASECNSIPNTQIVSLEWCQSRGIFTFCDW